MKVEHGVEEGEPLIAPRDLTRVGIDIDRGPAGSRQADLPRALGVGQCGLHPCHQAVERQGLRPDLLHVSAIMTRHCNDPTPALRLFILRKCAEKPPCQTENAYLRPCESGDAV